MSYNKVILIGYAGKDPEIRYLDSGVAVASLTLATSERVEERSGEWREITEWHNLVFWRNLAEYVEKYIRKGSLLFVEGKIRTRSWDSGGQKRYITEIVVENMRLLNRKETNNQQNSQQTKPADNAGDKVDVLPF
jgi:single-strand DNA-binding protein